MPEQYEADLAYGRRLNAYRSVEVSVRHNSVPTVDNAHLYNGGSPCTRLRPYPRIGSPADTLQALGTDGDEMDKFGLTMEAALWPAGDPASRTVFTREHGTSGRVNTVSLPAGTLTDGASYGWQARISDGTDTSSWSKECYFTYDESRPSAPTISSSNYPASGSATWAPVGVPGKFTFSGNGDPDVAGFQYSWNDLGGNGCSYGDLGQLVCKNPLDAPGTIKPKAPGGSATVTLSPADDGPRRLTVRSIDTAGNVSSSVVYEVRVPTSDPQIVVQSGKPRWGEEVLLKFTPAEGVTGVREYEIVLDGQQPETREADENGTAYFSFTAGRPEGHNLRVRSRSENGFVSSDAFWSTYFEQWPGVTSDIYVYPEDGHAVGGVGVQGTFTFSPPPGWTDTVAYRYSFNVFGKDVTEVAAGAGGSATITWAPTASGRTTMTVYAVRADGSKSRSNSYSFYVANAT